MKQFLYFLMTEDNRYYKASEDAVSIVSTPAPLTHTPDGWREIEIQRARNPRYFALDRSFTVPIDFVKDGARIVKHVSIAKTIEEKLYLAVAEERLHWDDQEIYITDQFGNRILGEDGQPILAESMGEYGFYYTLLYKGELDLSQVKITAHKVTVNVMEGGVSKLLKANENTKYEVPIDGEVIVKNDGVVLQQSATFIVINGITTTDLNAQNDEIHGAHTVALEFVQQEAFKSAGAINENRKKADTGFPQQLWDTGQYFLLTGTATSRITIKWNFNLYVKLQRDITPVFATRINLSLHVLKSATERVANYTLQTIGGGDARLLYDVNHNFQGSLDLENIPPDCRLVLYMAPTTNERYTFMQYADEPGEVSVEYTYRHPSSYMFAMRPLTLFTKLAAKLGIAKVQSTILEQYKHLVVTSGDAIRQFETPVIKTSFTEFFDSFNTILSLGMGIVNNTLILEHKSYFVDYSNPIELGECKDFKLAPSREHIFNTIKIGFPENDYENVNGRYEVNNTHIYTTPNTRVSKQLELVSVYRVDPYGIEFARINLDGKKTTDAKTDNNVFVMHIKTKPVSSAFSIFDYYEIDRSLNAYATGIEEPATIYNLWLSPKQCLFRNGAIIHSYFYNQNHLQLIFQTTEKNANLVVSEPNKPVVAEKANVEISSLPAAYFTPWLFDFENMTPVDIMDLLKQDPKRCYSFTVDGVKYVGLPIKDSFEPATRKPQNFIVASSPSNDLHPIIDYTG